MMTLSKTFLTARIALVACLLAFAGTGTGYSQTTTSGDTSILEQIVNAIRDWLASQNQNSSQPTATPDPAPSSSPDPAPSPASTSSPSATPSSLAAAIASDAGGHQDQYAFYADKLSQTLARMTPEQQNRIFKR